MERVLNQLARTKPDGGGGKMGKAAVNERRKLTATFLNNVAVVMVVTAVAVPVHGWFISTFSEMGAAFRAKSAWEMADRGLGVVSFLIIALLLQWHIQWRAAAIR
jgi:hypothetical protein